VKGMRREVHILWLLTTGPLAAQNLVPNPSFEQVTSCPTFASQLDHAAPWFNPTQGTPELYHGCAEPQSYVSVPWNTTGGYQYAHAGEAYAGVFTWRTDVENMREYAEVELTSPLQAGTCYKVGFYANMPNDHPYACDGIGAHFSVGPITSNNGYVLPYTADIANPDGALITDTAGWTLISGVYTAAGGETHITLGNFKNDASTQTLQIATGVWYQTSAYLLLDDVSVEPLVLELDLGPDTLICDGGTLLLDATQPDAQYLWNDGSIGATLLATQPGTYWAQVTLGACTISDTMVISGGLPPDLRLADDTTLCEGATLVLDASTPGASIVWMDGDTLPVRTVQAPGTYSVTATNMCGSTNASMTVSTEVCACVPFLPNVFTPNGDGINELIGPIFHCGTGTIDWTIYDRWGLLVFSGKGSDLSWDGKKNGREVPDGVYVWRARVNFPRDPDEQYIGHITLLR
jgi:gliding motility-associated-like protein